MRNPIKINISCLSLHMHINSYICVCMAVVYVNIHVFTYIQIICCRPRYMVFAWGCKIIIVKVVDPVNTHIMYIISTHSQLN